ncbi:MAG: RNA methyltransferase [Clostridiales bacterium]|nr:RNA methyltransferase [Clostridiales bacterium]
MITSTSNPQVKNLQQLAKKARARNEQGVFLVEGIKMFQEAPEDKIRKIYISKSLYEEKGQAFLKGLDHEILEDHVFAAVSDTKTPQGILCVVEQYRYRLEDMADGGNPHLLLLENLQDPGNLGTIMRTAEGAGADGIILSRSSVDLYNPKTIRSTMGSVYRMPFLYVDCLEEVLPGLKARGIRTYAAHLKGKNSYDEEDYRGGCAFFIGNEGNGLTEELSSRADTWIRIPMHGKLESLNAAVAASVLMYEVCRQRR